MDERLISNVMGIFSEITGAIAAASAADQAVIHFWSSKHAWKEYEFRLSLEQQWKNPTSRAWLTAEPGRINMKSFLNPKNEERLVDVLKDLKWAKTAQKKAAAAEESPDLRVLSIRCRDCLEAVDIKSVKTAEGDKFRWLSDLKPYETHSAKCFQIRIQHSKVM